jgi:hypothetical protein
VTDPAESLTGAAPDDQKHAAIGIGIGIGIVEGNIALLVATRREVIQRTGKLEA